jgi:hypothetical protein
MQRNESDASMPRRIPTTHWSCIAEAADHTKGRFRAFLIADCTRFPLADRPGPIRTGGFGT